MTRVKKLSALGPAPEREFPALIKASTSAEELRLWYRCPEKVESTVREWASGGLPSHQ